MIVVGFLGGAADGAGDRGTRAARELALEVAKRAAASGARVEMVGVADADIAGDANLVTLAAAGVGHATVVRTPASGLEPADLDLALHYLPDIHAMVLVEPDPGLLPVALEASSWADAVLVVIGPPELAPSLPSDALLLQPPDADPDGTFAGFVAALAVRVDAGDDATVAFDGTVAALAVDAVRPG